MSVKDKSVEFSRRGFLRGMAAAGGAAAATAVVSQTTNAEDLKDGSKAESAKQEALGYRETPHIREYYEKARF